MNFQDRHQLTILGQILKSTSTNNARIPDTFLDHNVRFVFLSYIIHVLEGILESLVLLYDRNNSMRFLEEMCNIISNFIEEKETVLPDNKYIFINKEKLPQITDFLRRAKDLCVTIAKMIDDELSA